MVTKGGASGSNAPAAPAGEPDPALATRFSDTWRQRNEPLTTRIYNTPVNYRGSDGAWHAIDSNLVASPLGGYENTANDFSLRLPESLSSAVTVSTAGESLSFTLNGASTSLPAVSGDTATYAGVLPSTDLAYVSEADGVREIATLKDINAPKRLSYSLSLPAGLTPRGRPDGSVATVDANGKVVFTIPAPVAYRPNAAPTTGRGLEMSVTGSSSPYTLTVDAGASWLREDLASGPVAIDPTVTVSATQACTLNAESPKTASCSSSTLQEGYDSTHQEHHALLQFSLSSLPQAAVILNAKLGLYVEAHSTSTAKAVGIYRVTKPWTTGATWETYDGTHAWSTAGGDYANPEKRSDVSVNASVGGSTGWYYWYPTRMVQEWVNTANAPEQEEEKEKVAQGYANEGLIVKDQKDSETQNLLTIASPTASANKPFIEVHYEPRGVGIEPQYTQLSTSLTDTLSLSVNAASGNLMLANQDLHIAGINGVDYSSTRTFNDLEPDIHNFGRWRESMFPQATEYGNGDVHVGNGTGALFVFAKQSNGTYITPPGIKATLCTATANKAPCPASLPSGVVSRLLYEGPDGHYVDFNSKGWAFHHGNRYENKLTSSTVEGKDAITAWTDTRGRTINYAMMSNGFYTETKDESGGRTLKYGYEGEGNGAQLTSYKDANGKVTKYHYEFGDLNLVTDPKGNVTKLVYDSKHRIRQVIRTTNSEHTTGPTTRFVYLEVGHAPSAYCSASQTATIVRDPDWEKHKSETEEEERTFAKRPHETLYCANVLDEVEKIIDAEGHESKAAFDQSGNETSFIAPPRESGANAGVTSRVYGVGGVNLECKVDGTTGEPKTECPLAALKEGYSTRSDYLDATFPFQATHETEARQKSTNFCYWGGSHECTGSSTTGETGENGALRRVTDPLATQNSLNYSYNKDGTVSSTTDANGHTTTDEYDSSANLKTIIPPSGSGIGKETTTVDALSRPKTITQCLVESGGSCTSSETSTLTYDKLDRVTEAVDTGPGATKTFKYTFDTNGNLEKRVDPAGTTNFKHDTLNRLTEEALPGSISNSYAYDETSNPTSFTDSGGTSRYFYNGLNEVEAMYEPGGSCGETPSNCTHFTYDADGSLTKITYASKASLNYSRDPTTGRSTAITAKSPTGTTLLSNSYSYTEGTNDTPLVYNDLFAGPSSTTASTTYEYDALNRVVKALTSSEPASYASSCYLYAYDGSGNRTSEGYTTVPETCSTSGPSYNYNAGNELECRMEAEELCSKSSTTEISGYTYDGAGNETAITGYKDPASTSFAFNNLSQLEGLTPPGKAEEKLKYLGSGQGKLTGLGTTTLQNSALGLTKQTIEGSASYYARTPNGTLIDERLPGATSYNPIYDAQGDIIGLLNSSGALVQSVRYGPYGENTNTSGTVTYSTTNDPFLFQGGYHLAGGNTGAGNVPNGLYHYGERYYDPTIGRWTQSDQLTTGGSYGFAGDDPVNNTDPSGECFQDRFGQWGPDCAGNPFITSHGGEPPQPVYKCFRYYAQYPETEHPEWRTRCVPKRRGLRGCIHKVFSIDPFTDLGSALAFAADRLAGALAAEGECFIGAREVEYK